MSRFRSKKKQQYRNANRGSAMIVVICVMAVVTVLSLLVIMAAYQMLASANDETRDELYYQQAMSFAEVMRTKLETKAMPGSGTFNDELIDHIDAFMRGEEATEILKADMVSAGGNYGGLQILLDKKSSRGNLLMTVSVDDGTQTMATCTCKFLVREVSGNLTYEFHEYTGR